jgi:hypothetical protein
MKPDRTAIEPDTRLVVITEGESDRGAIESVARRLGIDLAARGVVVVALGGITNFPRAVREFTAMGLEVAGLYDRGEEEIVGDAMASVGANPVDPRSAGFFRCDPDLEHELIRAAGEETVLRFIEEQGEATTFSKMRRQPAQRGRTLYDQMHRFFGIRSGRKVRYGTEIVDWIDEARLPRPLIELVEFVR